MGLTDQSYIKPYLEESAAVLAALVGDPAAQRTLGIFGDVVVASLRSGGKLMIAGNGGSAGDAQHIAAEFVVRLMFDRAPLAAIALTTDSSILTSGANDYGFDYVFERQVIALGRPGDVLLGISTSGRSSSILRALRTARELGVVTLGFGGGDGGGMVEACDHLFLAPSNKTAMIQQAHVVAAHIVCALVERAMFPRN